MGPIQTLQDLHNTGTAALKNYRETKSTDSLRTVAMAFVDAREHFFTRDGEPDWLGSTHAYRQWTREVFDRAGIPEADLSRLQAAIRYHTGNIMRERLDPAEVADLGLRQPSPRERAVEKRERASETLNLFGGGHRITDPAEAVAALAALEVTLRRIADSAVHESSDAAEKLGEIVDRARHLAATAGGSAL